MDQKAARALLGRSLEQPLVIFTGAGISRRPPASLPVNRELLVASAAILRDVIHDPGYGGGRALSFELAASVVTLPLEHFLELLVQASGPSAIEVMGIFAGGRPNVDHHVLAELCQRGARLFTLNFDLLHEAAHQALVGVTPRTVATVADFKALEGGLRDPLTVYHLHGVLDETSGAANISTTLASIRTRLHASRARVLRAALANRNVLCLGYGNGDIDTFPLVTATSQRIFWYHHEGDLPPPLAAPTPELAKRLVVLHRSDEEAGVAELLRGANPGLFRSWLEPDGEPEDSCGPRLRRFEEGVTRFIGMTGNRCRAVRFMLASLAADRGRYKDAVSLLEASCDGGAPTSHLATQEQLLLGHCCELAGLQVTANRVFAGLQQAASQELVDMARLNRASAALGDWKFNPIKIWRLARWRRAVHGLRNARSEAVQHRRDYEIGDFFQFLGETFLVPSAAMGVWFPARPVRATWLLRLAESISGIWWVGAVRRCWLRRAALSYLRMIRRIRVAPVDPAPGFTILAQLRTIECAVSLSKRRLPLIATSWLDEAEAYYRWAHSQHGLGNVSCTRGIVAMRSNRATEAEHAFEQALERYGDHAAGIRKVAICRWRLAMS